MGHERHLARPQTIIVDLDGTLVDLMSGIVAFFRDHMGIWLPPDFCKQHDVAESLWQLGRVRQRFDSMDDLKHHLRCCFWDNPHFYARAQPYADLHSLLQLHINTGGRVAFITARPVRPLRLTTRYWLAAHGYGDAAHELRFESDAAVRAEAAIDLREGRTWLIDDCPGNCRAAAAAARSGPDTHLWVFAPVRPWVPKNEWPDPVEYYSKIPQEADGKNG